jgi:hypothetical protein
MMKSAYCKRCSYPLRGLDSQHCPECGTPFDWADRRSYRCTPKRRIGIRLFVLSCAPLGVLVAVLALIHWRVIWLSEDIYVCTDCGIARTERNVRFGDRVLYTLSGSTTQTVLSALLPVHDHRHSWTLAGTAGRSGNRGQWGFLGPMHLGLLWVSQTPPVLHWPTGQEPFPGFKKRAVYDILREPDGCLSISRAWMLEDWMKHPAEPEYRDCIRGDWCPRTCPGGPDPRGR